MGITWATLELIVQVFLSQSHRFKLSHNWQIKLTFVFGGFKFMNEGEKINLKEKQMQGGQGNVCHES